ncbi:hypothetical protein ACFOKI_01625 [Sphingomonas qilianensis]|uniref:Uncharacterized protein n=1 Tax=Sphingomonas qilianensis TaxID=1736690 RepID=A0ABU9XTZ2_9SPHN
MRTVLVGLLLLAGCTPPSAPTPSATPTPAAGLEAAAIEAGLITDPASNDITGLYARDSDRVCIVPAATDYRIGVSIDHGDGPACDGSGTVARTGDALAVDFPAAPGCSFAARFDADRIVFPGQVPDACRALCRARASIAALSVDRLSDSASEASALRDTKGRLLCGGSG